jgi:di/tricarboxylate transporter
LFFIVLIAALVLFITEWIRADLVAVMVVITLAVTRILTAEEALSGFSSEPAIIVAGIFVLSGALHATGLSETIGRWVGKLAGKSLTRATAVIMSAVALMSAFTHHVTTTAVMVPVILNLSQERKIAASKLLMPMSFAASLGTAITIIGAPAFLIASTVLQQSGRPGLGIFSIAPIGLVLTLAGVIFVLLIGRFLLPDNKAAEGAISHFRLQDYLTEIVVSADSSLLKKTVAEIEESDAFNFKVLGIIRRGRRLPASSREETLKSGDVLIVRTTPEDLVSIRERPQIELRPIHLYGPAIEEKKEETEEDAEQFVQAIVAPKSDLVGRTLGEVDFQKRFGAVVISLWRKNGWLDKELSKVKLRANDVLVLEGDHQSLARVAEDPAFLMMIPFHREIQPQGKAWLAGVIMLATILLAAFNILSIEIATIAGAVAVVLTGCLSIRRAYDSIETRIFVFIAGAIPLGVAMQKTGTANLLAGWMQSAVADWPERLTLLALFAIVAILTQFMSDAATTAVFAPVAVALAQALGRAPEPFVVTVAMAAVVAFLTPIGHHGNLLVYSPGRYRFGDFVKVGTPLTIICGLIVVMMAPLIWR